MQHNVDITERWVELVTHNDNRFKFYIKRMKHGYIGGYLAKSSLSYPNWLYRPYSWSVLQLNNNVMLNFYMISMNENFLSGYLLQNEIKDIDQTIIRFQQFFEDYDRRFNPMFVMDNEGISIEERHKRIELVGRTELLLQQRVEERLQAALQNQIPVNNQLPQLDVESTQNLSEKQIELFCDYYRLGRDVNHAAVDMAFELFSNGELMSDKYAGNLQPNSSSEFNFAEFALLAIGQNICPAFWIKLLRAFLHGQELFIHVYRPNGIHKPQLYEYSYRNFKFSKQLTDNQKWLLRQKYHSIPFSLSQSEWAFANNLLRALE